MSNWKQIWEKREADYDILNTAGKEEILVELKRAAGFDITEEGLNAQALLEQYEMTKRYLSGGIHSSRELSSVYEVGCGSGANLFLFESDGLSCGGIDYSQSLIDIAKKVLRTEDLECDEAIKIPDSGSYDAVLSNSVFSYFPDEGYAEEVLEKILQKSNFSIGILDVHDMEKREDFVAFRKRTVENYEERYKDLPKLFYRKAFFEEFAKKHGLAVSFPEYNMPGYWNNEFIFHCFMYKE